MPSGILDVNGLKASLVLLPVLDHTDTASISPTSHHHNVPNIKLNEVYDLVGLQVKFDGVIGLDKWIWVANGAPIIGVQIGNALVSKSDRSNLA